MIKGLNTKDARLQVPSHKHIDPNEFVDALAKEALDADQPDFVSYSLALARVKARMKSKWDCVARDANAVHYWGRHLWVSDDPLLHGTTAATTWLLKHAGKSNADVARAARILTNHFPTRQLRAQCGWSAGDVLEFLRLNPMVSTFGWAEILAEALADRAAGRPHSRANARLQAHTTERVFRWRQFYQDRGKVPELACARSDDFDAFTLVLFLIFCALDLHICTITPLHAIADVPRLFEDDLLTFDHESALLILSASWQCPTLVYTELLHF
ncbi:hypothetical protein IEO21_08269 [Rhodonia placenta]|uniref:Uncharacterized protein n=1 Tax=Rhodonia placenta TaxID=104341 RepID=A0A8H7NWM2_9APHY|nr:hypothetical protein IEO21_08269 [Postia placenta]